MTVVLAAIEEGIAIGAIFRRRVELAAFAIARRAVSLDVAQMGGGLCPLRPGARTDRDLTITRRLPGWR